MPVTASWPMLLLDRATVVLPVMEAGVWVIVEGLTVSEYVHVPLSPKVSVSPPMMVYGEPLVASVPVLARTLPRLTAKPGVLVVKVTGPTKPELALRVSVKVELEATLVDPDFAGP